MEIKTSLKRRCLSSWLLSAGVIFASVSLAPAYAAVVINEIFYDAEGSDDNREWLELHNPDGVSHDLTNWRFLESATQHKLVLSQGSFDLSSGSFAVIAEDASTFLSDHPSFTGNLYDSSFSLSNSGETLSFLDGPSGNLVDTVTYASTWGGGNGLSLQRVSSSASSSNDPANWSSSAFGGTPGSENIFLTPTPTATPTPTSTPTPTPTTSPTPTPIAYPVGIYISELMPNPKEGEKEWVEIYNSNSFETELNDWSIDDKDGGSAPQSFTKKISGFGYHQVVLTSNKLNNDGDLVRLLRPDLSVADSLPYSSSQKGVSWMKDGSGSWLETDDPSPGQSNRYLPVGGFPHKNNILELKKLTLGSKIELEAFVSVPLDIFSEDEFYIVDNDSGIKISVSTLPPSKPALGDKIHVASTIEETNSEKYIKTESYEILATGQPYPETVEIRTGEIAESNEGRLVKISGEYQESDGDNFFIDDSTGPAKIYLKDSTGIIKLKMEVGDVIEIQGIVSQYGHLKDGRANYRVMPRFQSDMRNVSAEERLKGTVLGTATQLPLTGGHFYRSFLLIGFGLVLKAYVRILA